MIQVIPLEISPRIKLTVKDKLQMNPAAIAAPSHGLSHGPVSRAIAQMPRIKPQRLPPIRTIRNTRKLVNTGLPNKKPFISIIPLDIRKILVNHPTPVPFFKHFSGLPSFRFGNNR